MSTSSEDEMIIDLSQNDNWVKAKFYIEVKCYNYHAKETEDQDWHDIFSVSYI